MQVMASRNDQRLIADVCVSSYHVIAIGLRVGKAAAYGVLLSIVSTAFVKALSGVIRVLPVSGLVLAVGS